MFWLRNKKIKFSLSTLNLSPGGVFVDKMVCENSFVFDLVMRIMWKLFRFQQFFGGECTVKLFLHGITSQ